MTEDEVLELVTRLPDVVVVTASEASGAPQAAWGDSFCFYDPTGDGERHSPFATIVTQNYEGFDTESDLNRPGVFRVNVAVGRAAFEALFDYAPAAHADHHAEYDYAALDRLLPHPIYAAQGWVSVLNPAAETQDRLASLLTDAHDLAAKRHQRRASLG